jgi:hypothetical protein
MWAQDEEQPAGPEGHQARQEEHQAVRREKRWGQQEEWWEQQEGRGAKMQEQWREGRTLCGDCEMLWREWGR